MWEWGKELYLISWSPLPLPFSFVDEKEVPSKNLKNSEFRVDKGK
jgi:hypothetical protein